MRYHAVYSGPPERLVPFALQTLRFPPQPAAHE
jgi:hypothetical protein